jgi:hypothetical protein
MRLYHFTCLFWLPPIMRVGLINGEAPLSGDDWLQAVNLTSNPSAEAQHWCRGTPVDKTKVRLTVHLPEGDARLERFRDACKRLGVRKDFQKRLDAYGQGKFWFYWWGTVPPEWIESVEVRAPDGTYAPCQGEGLQDLLRTVEEEWGKFEVTEDWRGFVCIRFKPGVKESWLLDGNPDGAEDVFLCSDETA